MSRRLRASEGPADCYTLKEFCASHRIGVSSYYKIRADGQGPIETRLGGKVLITKEAAARWRAERAGLPYVPEPATAPTPPAPAAAPINEATTRAIARAVEAAALAAAGAAAALKASTDTIAALAKAFPHRRAVNPHGVT